MEFIDTLIQLFREWKKKRAEDRKIQEMYRRLDLNKDGRLSKREKIDSTKELVKKAKAKNKNDLDKKALR